jgi:hypothetical protein
VSATPVLISDYSTRRFKPPAAFIAYIVVRVIKAESAEENSRQ